VLISVPNSVEEIFKLQMVMTFLLDKMARGKKFKSALLEADFCGEPIFGRVQQILT
jgi:hypothetical protein